MNRHSTLQDAARSLRPKAAAGELAEGPQLGRSAVAPRRLPQPVVSERRLVHGGEDPGGDQGQERVQHHEHEVKQERLGEERAIDQRPDLLGQKKKKQQ